jgi:hypothetical protein
MMQMEQTMTKQITNILELRAAIKNAKEVLIGVRFGVSEKYLKISKKEAYYLLENIDQDSSPRDFEMYSGVFGEMDSKGILILG